MTEFQRTAQHVLSAIKDKRAGVMSDGYLALWNDEEQARIDSDIEAHRKADAELRHAEIPPGTEVSVEQMSHEFVFGAHLFNFDQLGSDELNARYKELYGSLFNSATIPFYWRKFEMEEGKPRFAAEDRDTAAYWNSVKDPKEEPHWRRPATDPLVTFCEEKGIRLHGHTLVWGNYRWHMPDWLLEKIPALYWEGAIPGDNPSVAPRIGRFETLPPEEIEALLPGFTTKIHTHMAKRIIEIALRYKDRFHSWDIVNESATDFGKGNLVPGAAICKSWYGLMPGDYPFRAFKIAEGMFPENVQLNINDYDLGEDYLAEINQLKRRGCKIDIVGAQMHLFDPRICLDIADGKSELQSPASVRKTMELLSRGGSPIHLSEITITSPGTDERGQLIQAVIARNLYRLWFSLEPLMGITWWNVVDDCGAPGEPSVSGLFTREMRPKASYFALNDLINSEWKTILSVRADANGTIRFRGFPGKYRLDWKGPAGNRCALSCELSKSGGLRVSSPVACAQSPASL